MVQLASPVLQISIFQLRHMFALLAHWIKSITTPLTIVKPFPYIQILKLNYGHLLELHLLKYLVRLQKMQLSKMLGHALKKRLSLMGRYVLLVLEQPLYSHMTLWNVLIASLQQYLTQTSTAVQAGNVCRLILLQLPIWYFKVDLSINGKLFTLIIKQQTLRLQIAL